jgi:hypothetical protein
MDEETAKALETLPDGYDATDRAMLDAIVAQPGVHRTDYGEVAREQLHVVSRTVAAFDRRTALEKSDPLLALAYLVEAIADGRAAGGGDVGACAYSKLATIGANAKRLLRAAGHSVETGLALYPPAGILDRGGFRSVSVGVGFQKDNLRPAV